MNPTVSEYLSLQPGTWRQQFRAAHLPAIREGMMREFSVMDANTLAAALVPDYLADAMVVVANNKLAMLRAFTRDFGVDELRPRATVQVRKATTGSAVQSNPTNFETGDTTLAAIAVTVNQLSASFHVTNAEFNQGHRLDQLAGIHANLLADAISDVVTALLIAANYASPVTVGAAADFSKDDLPLIWGPAKNFKQRNLLLDGAHLAYLLPTSRDSFAFGDTGAYGFDLLLMHNRWTGAVANTCGFICGPEAIAVASGLPASAPAGEVGQRPITLEGLGLSILASTWFSRGSRSIWASYDVMFGAAVGDASQAEILVTS